MIHMHDDPDPYDVAQPFNADELLDGFTGEERQVPVDPDSPLGRAMAAARESWAQHGLPDPDDFHFEPIPVDLAEEWGRWRQYAYQSTAGRRAPSKPSQSCGYTCLQYQ